MKDNDRIARALPEDLRSCEHVLVPPVDDVSGFEEAGHYEFTDLRIYGFANNPIQL